jgi:hypothetical protein
MNLNTLIKLNWNIGEKMKKIFKGVILIFIISFIFSGCNFSKDIKFGQIEIGANFMSSRDGYYKKLPYNYCLNVNFRSKVQLFKVADEYVDQIWDSSIYYDCSILEGHFIKGFFNDNYLVLCEEENNNNLLYLSFNFFNGDIQYYANINELHDIFENQSYQWFLLCNTNQEIQNIK